MVRQECSLACEGLSDTDSSARMSSQLQPNVSPSKDHHGHGADDHQQRPNHSSYCGTISLGKLIALSDPSASARLRILNHVLFSQNSVNFRKACEQRSSERIFWLYQLRCGIRA